MKAKEKAPTIGDKQKGRAPKPPRHILRITHRRPHALIITITVYMKTQAARAFVSSLVPARHAGTDHRQEASPAKFRSSRDMNHSHFPSSPLPLPPTAAHLTTPA